MFGAPVGAEDGLMPIEQVNPGQRVWAYDLGTNQWVLCDVEATFDNGVTDDLLDIVLKTEDGVTETLRTTPTHPFWVSAGADLLTRPQVDELLPHERQYDSGRWVQAEHLSLGGGGFGKGSVCHSRTASDT